MSVAGSTTLDGGLRVSWRFTDRHDGDLSIHHPGEELDDRRRAISEHPWTWLRQVHGSSVVTVGQPGDHCGVEADGAVTATPGAALAAHSADCPPVLFVGSGGVVGAAHAGWRGLAAGVLQNTVRAMQELRPGPIRAMLGPCIHPSCYEFGADDLATVVGELGPTVASTTPAGTPALDLLAGVRAALSPLDGVDIDLSASRCSACTDDGSRYFSHRARQEHGRQAGVIWLGTESAVQQGSGSV